MFWEKFLSNRTKSTTYDIAISYAQGIPTYYVADKVTAKLKFAWVNVSYRVEGFDRKFNKIIMKIQQNNSGFRINKQTFLETFPNFFR